ncbi:ABC transporter permease [Roseimicrobium sp. ORNL1]|uniref:ABC transporter permease n=1 Tax=Roseimicrobium sp. ORNL1 TaxID=2711231 RepID=UPI001F0D73F0|nr:ABC transporter permease [Roseimicrobium sp. ORNL1]
MNWFLQVFSIILFNLRSLPERKGSALSAAVGIAGVVAVLVGVLSIAEGFRKVMSSAGEPDAAIVLRAGADNEMNSGLTREDLRIVRDAPGVARAPHGETALASGELLVIVDRPKRTTGTDANVPLRGVEPAAFDVRRNLKIVEGRRLEPGRNEVIVGSGATTAFAGLDVGQSFKVGQNTWEIVGIFTADGGVAESEIWGDAAVIQAAYKRENNFQSVHVRLNSSESFQEFKDALTSNPQLKVKVSRLSDFYAEQSEMLSSFITGMGVFIAGLMALGALFGALNTMYGSISARTREIATLRALGFGASPVIFSVLGESLVLALVGGAIGAAIAYFAFNGMQTSTMNWQTFSQVTFAFAVTPALLLQAIIWASIIGLLGGIFPAIRAARLPIASALRET